MFLMKTKMIVRHIQRKSIYDTTNLIRASEYEIIHLCSRHLSVSYLQVGGN